MRHLASDRPRVTRSCSCERRPRPHIRSKASGGLDTHVFAVVVVTYAAIRMSRSPVLVST